MGDWQTYFIMRWRGKKGHQHKSNQESGQVPSPSRKFYVVTRSNTLLLICKLSVYERATRSRNTLRQLRFDTYNARMPLSTGLQKAGNLPPATDVAMEALLTRRPGNALADKSN